MVIHVGPLYAEKKAEIVLLNLVWIGFSVDRDRVAKVVYIL